MHLPVSQALNLLVSGRSFFQSLCVLGYCILPLTVALLVCRLILLAKPGIANFIVRFLVVMAMFGWSTLGKAAVGGHPASHSRTHTLAEIQHAHPCT